MTEELQHHNYVIGNATLDDVTGIGDAHFESTRQSYPDEQAGIDEAWIDKTWGHFKEESGNRFRVGTIIEAQKDPDHVLYLAAKDPMGKVVGFIHATKEETIAKLEGLYLLEEAQGSGLAYDLMDRVLDFTDDLPVELEVAEYNEEAIRFYRKYKFGIVPNTKRTISGKLIVETMKREPNGEGGHEV